jgi:hypothetical protein
MRALNVLPCLVIAACLVVPRASTAQMIELAGDWTEQQDGTVFTIVPGGSGYTATYHGRPPHPALVGTLDGTFDGTTYAGALTVTEGSLLDTGTFHFVFSTDNVTDTLDGTLDITAPPQYAHSYPVTLTRPHPAAGPTPKLLSMSRFVEVALPHETFRRATAGMALPIGTRVHTGFKSSARVKFPDGHIVEMGPMTLLYIGTDGNRLLTLMDSGIVTIYRRGQGASDFELKDITVAASIRGTTCEVVHDLASATSLVAVKDGEVIVSANNSSSPPVDLHAGEEVIGTPGALGNVGHCLPTAGMAPRAGKPFVQKVKCTNTSQSSATFTVSAVTPSSCALVRPVGKSVPAGKHRTLKIRLTCGTEGEFFRLTGDGV